MRKILKNDYYHDIKWPNSTYEAFEHQEAP